MIEAFTLRAITNGVLEIVSAFNITDDSDIPIDFLEALAIQINQTLIKDAVKTNMDLSSLYTILDDVTAEMVTASTATIGGITFSSNKKLLVAEVDGLIDNIGWKDIQYVGSDDFSKEVSRKSLSAFNAIKKGQRTFHLDTYTKIGKKLFLKINNPQARVFKVSALIKDQRAISSYSSTDDFKTPSYYKLQLLMIQHIAQAFNFPADKLDDAQSALAAKYEQPKRSDK